MPNPLIARLQAANKKIVLPSQAADNSETEGKIPFGLILFGIAALALVVISARGATKNKWFK